MRVLLVALMSLFFLSPAALAEQKACIRTHCFDLDIASTPQKRSQGLMYQESLKSNQGMWFVFEKPRKYGFWMKNMQFPIDIIWVNDEYIIVHIAEDIPPCVVTPCTIYGPDQPATFVLEISAGIVGGFGFQLGDKVTIIDSQDS